jgi:hypothetical protein
MASKKKVVKKKVVKKVAKKKKVVAKKPKPKLKLKAVRGTSKGTKGQAKLKIQKKERLPRVGSTVIFTFKRGNERKDSWGVGTITSVVGPMANVQVGGEEYGFNVIVPHETTYKPTSIESSLHQFVIDAVFKSRKMKERELELDEKSFKKGFTQLEDIDELVKIFEEREQEAKKVEEQEAPKSDDLSVLYAAYAMQGPKAQQVVEQAEDLLDSDVRVSPDPEASREETHSFTGEVTLGDVVGVGAGFYEVLDNGALAFVHEDLTEEQKLDIVREVQQTP